MIVDGNCVNLNTLQLMLKTIKFQGQVKSFQSSRQAIDFIRNEVLFIRAKQRHQLDMIITDSDLPVVSGLNMICEMNQLYETFNWTQGAMKSGKQPSIKPPAVLMQTNKPVKAMLKEAKVLGIQFIVHKPLRQQSIKLALQQCGLISLKQKDDKDQSKSASSDEEYKDSKT